MAQVVFVTSSSPSAGKTVVAAALLRQLAALGARPVGVKIIELGAAYDAHHDLVGADGDRLGQATPVLVPPLVRSPYRFTARTTPAVAADRAGLTLALEDLVSAVTAAAEYGGPVVVEGAGAALSALAGDAVNLDLAEHVGATVVLVVPERAGEESAALGALEACRRRGLRIAGVCRTPGTPGWSAEELRSFFHVAGVRDLGTTAGQVEDQAVDRAMGGLGAAVAEALAWP